ncbi:MAG: hypothetical protein QX196_08005, partial [Methylococcaceae bacterium]
VANAANAVKGTQGPAGEKEATGETKEAGETGPQGPIGLTGDTGPAGPQGTIGLTGPEGPASTVAGPQGTIGLTGPEGPASTVAGPAGPIGPEGPVSTVAGPAGPVGPASTVAGPPGIPSSGTDIGDMQYWDGSTWVMIPAPNPLPKAPLMATLHFCNGVPTWSPTCLPVNYTGYIIGNPGPAGGKVFYLNDNTGLHGLEAAPADQLHAQKWGCYETTVGGTSAAVGTGKANTVAINAQCGMGTAAQIAASYSLNGNTDWYLPSKDELVLLHDQQDVVGGFTNFTYCSSTEYSSFYVWIEFWGYGNMDLQNKLNGCEVRAIRSF